MLVMITNGITLVSTGLDWHNVELSMNDKINAKKSQ